MGTWEDELKIQKWLKDKEDRGEELEKNNSLLRFTRWPNPFTKYVDDIEVLMCSNNIILLIKGAALGFLYYGFTTFVPSPVEIGRKIITGGYGCGFYLLPGIPSPLDIIGRNRAATRFVAKITAPATGVLYYLWGQDAIFSALSTFTSLIYAARKCDLFNGAIELGGASTPINFNTDDAGIGLIEEIYDPHNWKVGFGGQWLIPHNGTGSGWWAFGLLPTGIILNSFSSWIQVDDDLGSHRYDYQEAVVDGPDPTTNVVHAQNFAIRQGAVISLRFAVNMTLLVPLGRLTILTDGAGGTGPLEDEPDGNANQGMTPWEPICDEG